MYTPLIVGPFGMTLQWHLGIMTGFMLCFIFARLTGHRM